MVWGGSEMVTGMWVVAMAVVVWRFRVEVARARAEIEAARVPVSFWREV